MAIAEHLQEYYKAFVEKNAEYQGVFYVGVKTTGVFCRPTCPAKKPKFNNCEFFETAQQALAANYRPCKRCQPVSFPNQTPELIQKLIQAVEQNPSKRWKDDDFQKFNINTTTLRRQFKKRFGITFVEYVRAMRMEHAMKQISSGEAVIEAQLSTGYESSSGFREAFSRIIGTAPSKLGQSSLLKSSWLDTKLGPIIAVSDEKSLYLLEFADRCDLRKSLERLRKKTGSTIIPGRTRPIDSITEELNLYFEGELREFKTPISLSGSPLQQQVWKQVKNIPYGQTRSYSDIAILLGKPSFFRAIAQANRANHLTIIIPCHRVIDANDQLDGYNGGLTRKKWLLTHEKKFSNILQVST